MRLARPLHKRLLLHPASVLLLLCVGVLLSGLSFMTSADSYDVSAVVPAVLPNAPAVITAPADQTHFTTRPITVKGTCPQNTYVKLFRNNVLSGVAICGTGQTTFEIATDLVLGSNVLLPQVFNITDQPGPVSSPITVFYANPLQPPAPTPTSTAPAIITPVLPQTPQSSFQQLHSTVLPFFITTDFTYQPRIVGKPFNLNFTLSGGTGPYAVTVQWGDGTTSTLVRSDRSEFSVQHTYTSSRMSQQLYIVKIQAVDSAGSAAFLQVAEPVHGSNWLGGAPLVNDASGAAPLSVLFKQWVWFAWPAYAVTVLMVLSFWLGERQEYYNLFSRKLVHHRRT